jgi:hypothetical protein
MYTSSPSLSSRLVLAHEEAAQRDKQYQQVMGQGTHSPSAAAGVALRKTTRERIRQPHQRRRRLCHQRASLPASVSGVDEGLYELHKNGAGCNQTCHSVKNLSRRRLQYPICFSSAEVRFQLPEACSNSPGEGPVPSCHRVCYFTL